VCGIPFSIQTDKLKLLTNKVYFDLYKAVEESNKKFEKMSNSETLKVEAEKIKEYRLKEIEDLETKKKLTQEEKKQVEQIKLRMQELENLLQKEEQKEGRFLEKLINTEDYYLDELLKEYLQIQEREFQIKTNHSDNNSEEENNISRNTSGSPLYFSANEALSIN